MNKYYSLIFKIGCLSLFTITLSGQISLKSIGNLDIDIFPHTSNTNDTIFDEIPGRPGKTVSPGIGAEKQSGLFNIYNSIIEPERSAQSRNTLTSCSYFPYTNKNTPVNAYPRIFYLNAKRGNLRYIDTLKYNWRGDVITSICMDEETMMWSSCDTLYTKGNNVSRTNHGNDIGNTLYDRALIDELRYRDRDTVRFKNEINGIFRYDTTIGDVYISGRPKLNYYCKLLVMNGKVMSYFLHLGSMTKGQYRALPEEEKKRVKLFKSEHNSDL